MNKHWSSVRNKILTERNSSPLRKLLNNGKKDFMIFGGGITMREQKITIIKANAKDDDLITSYKKLLLYRENRDYIMDCLEINNENFNANLKFMYTVTDFDLVKERVWSIYQEMKSKRLEEEKEEAEELKKYKSSILAKITRFIMQ